MSINTPSHPARYAPPLRFKLIRDTDVSGISGEGHVADGVVWPDGTCTLRWRGELVSTAVYDALSDLEKIHGHNGATRIEMLDLWPRENAPV